MKQSLAAEEAAEAARPWTRAKASCQKLPRNNSRPREWIQPIPSSPWSRPSSRPMYRTSTRPTTATRSAELELPQTVLVSEAESDLDPAAALVPAKDQEPEAVLEAEVTVSTEACSNLRLSRK